MHTRHVVTEVEPEGRGLGRGRKRVRDFLHRKSCRREQAGERQGNIHHRVKLPTKGIPKLRLERWPRGGHERKHPWGPSGLGEIQKEEESVPAGGVKS